MPLEHFVEMLNPFFECTLPLTTRLRQTLGTVFFAQLGLLKSTKTTGQTVYHRTWANERLFVSDKIVEHSILRTLAVRHAGSATISSMYAPSDVRGSPGVIFGLTRDGFSAIVERISRQRSSDLTLTSMPGEDALVVVQGDIRAACLKGDCSSIDELYYG